MARQGEYDDYLGSEREAQFDLVTSWVEKRMTWSPQKTLDQREVIVDLFESYHDDDDPPNSHKAWEDWEQFQDFMTSSKYPHQRVVDKFPWQAWNLGIPNVNYHTGLKDCYHITLHEGAGTLHRYRGIPDPIVKQLLAEKQDDVDYFMGALEVRVIDAVCSVPALPEQPEAAVSAEWAINPKLGVNKWQRRMDPERVMGINTWVEGNPGNHILNSVLLYIPPEAFKKSFVELSDDGILSVSFDFLAPITGTIYCDWRTGLNKKTQDLEYTDERPIWILDGQHRTRGLSLSQRGSRMCVPVIILTSQGDGGITKSEAAKLFTEINTLGASLEERLKFFLCNRFETAGRGDTDFADPNEAGIDSNRRKRRRANRESYRLAAILCSEIDNRANPPIKGALYGSIQFQEDNSADKTHCDIEVWMGDVRKWFTTAPYPMGGMSQNDYREEVANYFEAWRETCNHAEWKNQPLVQRWISDRGRNHAYWEKRTPFKSLLKMYPWMIQHIEKSNPKASRPFAQRHFFKALGPVKFVDWKNTNLLKTLGKGAEPPRTFVMQWVQRAIEGGAQHEESIAMSTDSTLAMDPGKAIMSKPHEVDLLNKPTWPNPNKPSVLRVSRPKNTTDSPGVIGNVRAITISGDEIDCTYDYTKSKNEFEITVSWSDELKTNKRIDVRGDWENPNGTTSFNYKINK